MRHGSAKLSVSCLVNHAPKNRVKILQDLLRTLFLILSANICGSPPWAWRGQPRHTHFGGRICTICHSNLEPAENSSSFHYLRNKSWKNHFKRGPWELNKRVPFPPQFHSLIILIVINTLGRGFFLHFSSAHHVSQLFFGLERGLQAKSRVLMVLDSSFSIHEHHNYPTFLLICVPLLFSDTLF